MEWFEVSRCCKTEGVGRMDGERSQISNDNNNKHQLQLSITIPITLSIHHRNWENSHCSAKVWHFKWRRKKEHIHPNKKDDDDDGIWYVSFHLVRLFSLHIGQFVLDFTFSKLEWEQWDRMRATSHNWHARFVYFGIDILINKCPFWTNWMEIIVHLNGTHSRSNAQSFPFNSKSTLV